jgi:hypothetical protein
VLSAEQHVEVVDSHDRSDNDTSQMLQHPELRKGHDRVRAQQGQNKRRHI